MRSDTTSVASHYRAHVTAFLHHVGAVSMIAGSGSRSKRWRVLSAIAGFISPDKRRYDPAWICAKQHSTMQTMQMPKAGCSQVLRPTPAAKVLSVARTPWCAFRLGLPVSIHFPNPLSHPLVLTRWRLLSARSASRKQVVVQAGLQEAGKAALAGVAAAVIAAVSTPRRHWRCIVGCVVLTGSRLKTALAGQPGTPTSCACCPRAMSALSLTVPTDATGPLGAQAPAQAISYDDLQGLTYLQVSSPDTSHFVLDCSKPVLCTGHHAGEVMWQTGYDRL